jgi:recombination protein U
MKKKNYGKIFQEDFLSSIPENTYVYRLKDCAGWKGQTTGKGVNPYCIRCNLICPQSTRFTPANDMDYIVYLFPHLFVLELKSVANKSMPFKNVADNQLKGLLKASKYRGIVSGLLINFRSSARTFFLPIKAFHNYLQSAQRKSLPISEAENLGIEIPGELLRSRYRWDITKLTN